MLPPLPLLPAGCYDLASFDLSGMIECGRALRELGSAPGIRPQVDNADPASSRPGSNVELTQPPVCMEDAAANIVRFFHQHLVDSQGQPCCPLVRCFKTHRYAQLPETLAAAARTLLPTPRTLGNVTHNETHRKPGSDDAQPDPHMPCLTLLATAGDQPAWNDRRLSHGHAAIPLASADMVARAPMIATLFRQMGVDIEAALHPDPRLILDAEQRTFNVFHIEHAPGDPSVPAQASFVQPHGIRSVLGFGGLLPSGDLFAVILFSRITIPRATADLFRTIALDVKLALLPYTRGPIFATDKQPSAASYACDAVHPHQPDERGPQSESEAEQLRSETLTLRLLIRALEQAALHQTRRLEVAFADLHQQGEQVRAQGARLTAMLEATTDAVFLLDRTWRFTFLNRRAQHFLTTQGSLLGRHVWEAFPEAVGTNFWTFYHQAMNEGASVKFQEYIPAPVDRSFEVHAFPSPEGIAVFFHDITDRLRTEAALRQTEKLAATGRMAASIAHEINNPLEAVTNLLYLLAHDSSLGESATDLVRQAEQELQRVSEISTHMLRFHRQSTRPANVSLAEVLESVLVLFQGRLAHAGVEIHKRYQPVPSLPGHSGELRQVLANLVGNALDASPNGGCLLLRLRNASHPVNGVPGIRITVADTGTGMNKATTARLFEPFFTTKGMTGTGLGLWVSLELIQKHRGTVRVRSSQAAALHGTIFALFFPLGAPTNPPADADADLAPGDVTESVPR